ncbi:MAG: DUF502 domain-containing protein [Planctomycetes bacterium]|nr:DUF502 domain-containing protein [Planctomycetota bacterium]
MSENESKPKKSKRPFLRGLAVLLPSVLTLWLIVKAYQFIDSAIAEPINRGIRLGFTQIPNYFPSLADTFSMGPTPETLKNAAETANISSTDELALKELAHELFATSVDTWWIEHPWMNALGLLVAAIIVYMCGRLVGGFIGRALYRRIEKIMVAVPVIRKVYPYIKQLVDFLIADDDKPKFSRVVAVEYPRKGIWSVGFMTGNSLSTIESQLPDSITVFIPSSPTPFTGYTITVQKKDTIDLPITVEEAIRFAVSGGVLVPDHQSLTGLPRSEPAKMDETNPESD